VTGAGAPAAGQDGPATGTDLHFWFDPVCPFAWMTSRWVRLVAAQRAYEVQWRPISLRLLNRHVDYDRHFPPEYEAGHTAGLRLLRVVARTRAEHGAAAVGPLYEALGRGCSWAPRRRRACPAASTAASCCRTPSPRPACPPTWPARWRTGSWDGELQAETDAALALTGKDVGTPVLHFSPPQGVAFFGPVISRLPDETDAVRLWDHVIGLASFPGFAELKRSLRELPQLPALGVRADEVGVQEDWHGGSRRQKR
jgi:hypothetical protein